MIRKKIITQKVNLTTSVHDDHRTVWYSSQCHMVGLGLKSALLSPEVTVGGLNAIDFESPSHINWRVVV